MDHYEALGVPASAGAAEIRHAYLASAREHHPDFHVADDPVIRARHAARMKSVTEAWYVLGNVDRRAHYDLLRRQGTSTPVTERTRTRPEPDVPAGKGWTPRPGDDEWIDDFDTWADDRERFLPDDDIDSGRRNPVAVVPVALFVLAVVVGFLGLVVDSREMLAAAVAGVILSSVLFVILPLVAMTRHRPRRGTPSTTKRRTPFTGGRG